MNDNCSNPKNQSIFLSPRFDVIPSELKALPQWVCFNLKKKPLNPITGGDAKANDPETWSQFSDAVAYYEAHKSNSIAGIGYEFSNDDPYCGIDLDKCRNPKNGEIETWAQDIVRQLNSYTEISPSGRGLHILIKGKLPSGGRKKGKVEMYDCGRYFTMTGHHLQGTPANIQYRQKEINELHKSIFGQYNNKNCIIGSSYIFNLSDSELIEKACRANDGGKFERLWRGDISGYSSPSEADLALCRKLAYWTNNDAERIDRLFRQSGLCQHPDRIKKWNRLSSKTIEKAIQNTAESCTAFGAISLSNPSSRTGESSVKILNSEENKPETSPRKTLAPISCHTLAAKTFPPPQWLVPELLPGGLIILAGKPKIGKSWLALSLSVAVASGGKALETIPVEQGGVLYLALEDSERRLNERLNKITFLDSFPECLYFLTAKDFPPLHKGGLEALDNWLTDNQVRLVVIDTLARVKPKRGRDQDSYDADTAIIATLQGIAIKHNLALLVVHHTKKVEGDDFVENVSGTFGLTGAADCVAVLFRKNRSSVEATLKITGRDVPDMEKALQFQPEKGSWRLLGEAREHALSQEREKILLVLKENGPQTPAQLAFKLNKSRDSVKMTLSRMKDAGLIRAKTRGLYEII